MYVEVGSEGRRYAQVEDSLKRENASQHFLKKAFSLSSIPAQVDRQIGFLCSIGAPKETERARESLEEEEMPLSCSYPM